MKRQYQTSENVPIGDQGKVIKELKLGYLNLSDGAFEQAKMSFLLALQYDSKCADAYWGLMLGKLQIKNEDKLDAEPLQYKNALSLEECQKALEFASDRQLVQYQSLLEKIVKINDGDNY